MLFGWGNGWRAHRPYSVVPTEEGIAPALNALPPDDGGRAATPTAGVLDELTAALASARAAVANFLDLVSLEARRAGLALMWMLALGWIAAICGVAAWLALMAALAMWAVTLGVAPIAAVLAVSLLNCIAGAALIYACIGMSHDLLFPATRRQVAGKSPVAPPVP